jgi:phage recombination protein Bet
MADKEGSTGVALLDEMGLKHGISGNDLWKTIQRTIMPREANNEEMFSFLMVCREFDLNPLMKQIYAFKNKAGTIVPIIGVDGWSAVVNRQPAYNGVKFDYEQDKDGKVISCTCTIYRKDRDYPTIVTEFLSECWRDTDAWKLTPSRMLRHRAFCQGIRIAFGISGAYDEESADYQEMRDVTPNEEAKAPPAPRAPAAPSAPKKNAQDKGEARNQQQEDKNAFSNGQGADGDNGGASGKVVEGEIIPPEPKPKKAAAKKPAKEEPKADPKPNYRQALDEFVNRLDACETAEDIDNAIDETDILSVLQGSEEMLELAEEAINGARRRL